MNIRTKRWLSVFALDARTSRRRAEEVIAKRASVRSRRIIGSIAIVIALGISGITLTAQAQVSDSEPPQLMNFNFTPSAIDVSTGSQSVNVSLDVTDNLSGTRGVIIYFQSPSGQTVRTVMPLVIGTSLDGTYEGPVTFPQFGENGTWQVHEIFLSDMVSNGAMIRTDVLAAAGYPTQLEIVSTPADTQGPNISNIQFSPASMDVSAAPVSVTVDLTVTDELSGVVFPPAVPSENFFPFFPVFIQSPSRQQYIHLANLQFELVSGDVLNGTWRGTFEVPQYAEAGNWQVMNIALRDRAGNYSWLDSSQLIELEIPIELPIAADPTDTTPPQLISLDFVPKVINTSNGSSEVTVTMSITDDLAGVHFSPTTPFLTYFEAGINFRSPSGQQNQFNAYAGNFTLVSGTPLDGDWVGTVPFPQYSEDGTWWVDLLQVKDMTNNIQYFDMASLSALGFPTELVVLRPSLDVDGTVDASGGTIVDDTFGNRAQVTFPPGMVSTETEVAIDVFLDPLDIPTPSGYTGPGTLFVNFKLIPEPSYPLPAPGLTVVLPVPNPLIPGTQLDLFRVDPQTGDLVPATDAFGIPVVGTVNAPDGQSAHLRVLPSFRRFVGLVPDTIPVSIDIKPGVFPNGINPGSAGLIRVASYPRAPQHGDALDFDALSVDWVTLRFGPDGASIAHAVDIPRMWMETVTATWSSISGLI